MPRNDVDKPRKAAPKVRGGLPSLDVAPGRFLDIMRGLDRVERDNIPKASLVYGIGAAVLLGIALYYLFTGAWFTALLILVLAAGLFGYAVAFIKYG